jgi:LmbE family N-acetylglucosaminyl deacetylase
MIDSIHKVLVLAPHTDDGEFGAGATLARLARANREVYYVAFSGCEASVPAGWPKDILRNELAAATKALGLRPPNVRCLDFEVRQFARDRQSILEYLVKLNAEIDPDLVMMPTLDDLHQDHYTIAMEGLRAFKRTSILAYEVPWNNIQFRTECFVQVREDDVQAKVNAVECYQSQKERVYANGEFLRAQMRFRGTQAGVLYAEAFEVVRWIFK